MSKDKKTGRIEQLAERYATPLPIVGIELEALSNRVDAHLKKMGCMELNFGGGVVAILVVAVYACYTRARGQFDTLIRREKLFFPLWTVALAKGAA